MNDFNTTDQEQAEMIKRWWNRYGKLIVLAIAIGLAIGFGWRYWQHLKIERAAEASLLYQRLSISQVEKKSTRSVQIADELKKRYSRSPYAALAALWLAKQAVIRNDLPVALQNTRWVIDHSRIPPLKQIARLRAARILLAQKQPNQALALLETVDDKTFIPLIESVKGDVYTALGKDADAHKAYQAAKLGIVTGISTTDPLIDMKLAQPKEAP